MNDSVLEAWLVCGKVMPLLFCGVMSLWGWRMVRRGQFVPLSTSSDHRVRAKFAGFLLMITLPIALIGVVLFEPKPIPHAQSKMGRQRSDDELVKLQTRKEAIRSQRSEVHHKLAAIDKIGVLTPERRQQHLSLERTLDELNEESTELRIQQSALEARRFAERRQQRIAYIGLLSFPMLWALFVGVVVLLWGRCFQSTSRTDAEAESTSTHPKVST